MLENHALPSGKDRGGLKNPDIKRRVLFVALVPALIICIALSSYLLIQRLNEADTGLQRRGLSLVRQLAPAAEYGAFSANVPELQRLATAVLREADVTAVVFYDREGRPFVQVGTGQSLGRPEQFLGGEQRLAEHGHLLLFHARIQRQAALFEDTFQSREPVPLATEPLGSVTVAMSRAGVIAAKQEAFLVTILISMVALVAGILLSRRLGRDVTQPIVNLQQMVGRIHRGDLAARVDHHPGQALHDLEAGFNEMAEALQEGRDRLEQRISTATRELREKKEEAESTSLAKSRFLAAASHDLRQPLHALSLFVDELGPCVENSPQQHLRAKIVSAVHALNEQLNALLDISRLDLGNIRVETQPVALGALMQRVLAIHAPDACIKGLRLRCVPTRLWGQTDPVLLERMLGNFVANAVRYTERGGIVVGVRRRAGRLRLEVWDSGPGLNEEQIPMIFQEFYQVDNPERDARKGLGLGLSIVARLAQMLGHFIDVRSQPGRGSLFALELPCAPALPAGTHAAPRVTMVSALPSFDLAANVLVVDRDEQARDELCQLLTGWGCRTVGLEYVTDYEQGVQAMARTCVDALIFESHQYPDVTLLASRSVLPDALIMLVEPGAVPFSSSMDHRVSCAWLSRPLRPARLRALLQHLLQLRS